MNKVSVVGLDLAKNVFHLVGCNAYGKEVMRKVLKRGQVLAYFSNLPSCLIGMEACAVERLRAPAPILPVVVDFHPVQYLLLPGRHRDRGCCCCAHVARSLLTAAGGRSESYGVPHRCVRPVGGRQVDHRRQPGRAAGHVSAGWICRWQADWSADHRQLFRRKPPAECRPPVPATNRLASANTGKLYITAEAQRRRGIFSMLLLDLAKNNRVVRNSGSSTKILLVLRQGGF